MQKFRASYSVLDMWTRDWENAIAMYFKLETYVTRQMQEGREWHEKWAKEIEKTGKLPEVFGATPLKNPKPELKLYVPEYGKDYEWLELVGVIDCLDDDVIYEFKTGVTNSSGHTKSYQGGVYGILANLHKVKAKQVQIHHYNQYTRKADMSIIWLTPDLLAETDNWIKTISCEMYEYFRENNLFEKFGGIKK